MEFDLVKNLEFSHLLTLIAVVESDGFRAAADERGLAHSTVQKQMRELERQLGIPLFERSGRNIVATIDAHEVATAARLLIRSTEQFQSQVSRLRSKRTNTIRIGSCLLRLSSQLPFQIGRVMHIADVEHPELKVEFQTIDPVDMRGLEEFICQCQLDGASNSLNQALEDDRADFVITGSLPERSNIVLSNTTIVAVLPDDHPLRHNKEIDIKELKDSVVFAWPKGVWSRRTLERVAEDADVILNIVTESMPSIAVGMAKAGAGIAVMADDSSPLIDDSYPLLTHNGKSFTKAVRLHWRAERLTEPMSTFIGLLQKHMPKALDETKLG